MHRTVERLAPGLRWRPAAVPAQAGGSVLTGTVVDASTRPRLFRKVGVSSRAELVGLAASCLRNGQR